MILPPAWRKRACVVYDIADPEQWFDRVPEFKTEKRRTEWMLSRIAEKMLGGGKFVSFSHSKGYGAAAADDAPIGIDVEVVRDLPPAAGHLFLSPAEEAAAAACTVSDALLHFWSAKEARWKQLGGAVQTLKRLPLSVVRVRDDGIDFDFVETVRTGEVVVALTRPTS